MRSDEELVNWSPPAHLRIVLFTVTHELTDFNGRHWTRFTLGTAEAVMAATPTEIAGSESGNSSAIFTATQAAHSLEVREPVVISRALMDEQLLQCPLSSRPARRGRNVGYANQLLSGPSHLSILQTKTEVKGLRLSQHYSTLTATVSAFHQRLCLIFWRGKMKVVLKGAWNVEVHEAAPVGTVWMRREGMHREERSGHFPCFNHVWQ